LYVPVGQFVHSPAPSSVLYVPVGHGVH